MARPRPQRSRRFEADINAWYQANLSPTGGGLQFVKDVAVALLGEIIDRTPVKSGRARANWRVGLGAPVTGSVRTTDADGAATVRTGFLVIDAMKTLQPIWLCNNLPYSLRLERGSSQQAPHGMVALSIEAVGRTYSVTGSGLGQYVSDGRYRGTRGPRSIRRAA